MLGIVFSHDAPVGVDDVLNMSALVQNGVPALRVELRAVLGCLTKVGVVVQGKAVHPDVETSNVLQSGEEAFRPAGVTVGGVTPWPSRHEKGAHVDGKLRDILA